MASAKPIFKLSIDDRDISHKIKPRLISLNLTDVRGFEADQLDLELDDSDGAMDLPPRGAKIRLSLGWEDSGLIDKGEFTIDEVEHSGAPDKLIVRARSADLRMGLLEKRERSHEQQSLGDLIHSIASENNLTPLCDKNLSSELIAHLDQTGESDANLLTRLAEEFDAIATVKNGNLLFLSAGQATTVSGIPLEHVTITRQSGDSHRFSITDSDNYNAVAARYHDTNTAQTETITVDVQTGEPQNTERTSEINTSSDKTKLLRHTYANEANALRAARSAADKLRRGVATFSLTLAHGRPELFPELLASVSGWKATIDSASWLITQAQHRLDNNGFVTELQLELRLD